MVVEGDTHQAASVEAAEPYRAWEDKHIQGVEDPSRMSVLDVIYNADNNLPDSGEEGSHRVGAATSAEEDMDALL